MGFLEKMKNLFTEEEEIIEPVKKEVMQVEIKAPAPKPKREDLNEIEHVVPKMPEKPGPVFFEDKDFATLEPPKPQKPTRPVQTPKPKKVEPEPVRTVYQNTKKAKEKHAFKPSPIISPVYGILDKNYKKEDLVNKSVTEDDEFVKTYYKSNKEITLDEVRKKAFGTLEDDIDLNLNRDDSIMDLEMDETVGVTTFPDSLETDIFEKMDETKEEPLDLSLTEESDEITLGNNVADVEPLPEENDVVDLVEEEMDEKEEPLDDSDLFNLIDSMYEKRDE